MCVYRNDIPAHFDTAVRSIYHNQSLKPDEVIVVVDGPVNNEIEDILQSFKSSISLKIIRFKNNQGHATARKAGIEAASNEIIALMDADDISRPERFKKQLEYMEKYPDIAVLGGQIDEFIDTEHNTVGRRIVPCNDIDIYKRLKRQCPFNQMTVVMRKDQYLKADGYLDWHFNEDYYLWIRMAEAGCSFANLPDVLVNVRVGEEMYARRGGWKYFRSEEGLQRYMFRKGMISLPRYIYNTTGRFVVQVALPNKIRGWIFRKFFRQSNDING